MALGHFLSANIDGVSIGVLSAFGFVLGLILFGLLGFFIAALVITFSHDGTFKCAAPVTRKIARCELQFPISGNMSGDPMITDPGHKASWNYTSFREKQTR